MKASLYQQSTTDRPGAAGVTASPLITFKEQRHVLD